MRASRFFHNRVQNRFGKPRFSAVFSAAMPLIIGREPHMTSEWNLKKVKREDKTGIDLHAFYAYDVADEGQFEGVGA